MVSAKKVLSSWSYFQSISSNPLTNSLSTSSWNFFHSSFFPLHPLLFIPPLNNEDKLLYWQFGEKQGFLTVFGGGTQRGGGKGDSCFMMVVPEYWGLLRQ